MIQLKIKIDQLTLSKCDNEKSLIAYVEATIETDEETFSVTYSKGILSYERATITNNTHKVIKAVLHDFVAGLEVRNSFIVSLPSDDSDALKCKLE